MSFQGCDGAELLDWLFDQNDSVEKLEWLFDPNDGNLRHEGARNHDNHHTWPVSEGNVRENVLVSSLDRLWQTMQVVVFEHSTPQWMLSPIFPPSRCCRRPTRQTATSSTPSWLEENLYRARLCGPRLPATVGSVRIPHQTRETVRSVPKVPKDMLSTMLHSHQQRQAPKPASPVSHNLKNRHSCTLITPATGYSS